MDSQPVSRRALLLASAVLSLSPALASAQSSLTRISSEEVIVPLADGVGAARVPFLVEAKTAQPQCVATDAVGPLNAIPAEDVALTWEAKFPSADKRSPATLQIRIVTSSFTEPGVDYIGKVLCFWSDSSPSVSLSFKVKPRPLADFSISPESLDQVIGPSMPREARLRIRNTGRTEIREISASSATLTDPITRVSVEPFVVPKGRVAIVPIAPGEEKEFLFSLPAPALAGAYAGQLSVLANGRAAKTVSLTVRTRGPNRIPLLSRCLWFEYLPRLPFLLFLVALIIGYGISLLLEGWSAGGGLQRATAIRSLYGSLQSLELVAERIRNWESQNGSAFARNSLRRDLLAKELSGLLLRADGAPQTQLTEAASRAEQALPFYDALWGAVEVATQKIQDSGQRLAAAHALDAIEPGSDLAAYRKALENAIEQAASSKEKAAAAAASPTVLQLDPAAVTKQSRAIQRRMRVMEWLQRSVVWAAVFGTAYLTFLLGKFSFGTLQDYINVFFWAVGLTQTGTQLLARVRASRS